MALITAVMLQKCRLAAAQLPLRRAFHQLAATLGHPLPDQHCIATDLGCSCILCALIGAALCPGGSSQARGSCQLYHLALGLGLRLHGSLLCLHMSNPG